MSETRAQLEAWRRQNPGLFRGLQQALSRAEGTWRAEQPGYNVLFGGGQFSDYSKHPDRVIRSPGGYASAAAGAYQFLPGTYQEAARELGLKDFSPESQDLAMLYKVRQRLMPAGGLAAITKEGKFTPALQAYLAPEWASLPTAEGTSYYGQPVKKASQISAWFDEGARRAQAAAETPKTPTTKESAAGLLNRFIDLLGVTGAMQRFGPQSSRSRPDFLDYSEQSVTADPSSELLVDLYKTSQQEKGIQELAQEEAALQLRRNQAAMQEAKAQLLAQAMSSFGVPKAVI
jgi:muramidase (phage lysozyme)